MIGASWILFPSRILRVKPVHTPREVLHGTGKHLESARRINSIGSGLNSEEYTRTVRCGSTVTTWGKGLMGILVFIMTVGYYITPALVGGVDGQMISNLVEFHMRTSNNWELASALGVIMLTITLFLYWAYGKMVGVNNIRLG